MLHLHVFDMWLLAQFILLNVFNLDVKQYLIEVDYLLTDKLRIMIDLVWKHI